MRQPRTTRGPITCDTRAIFPAAISPGVAALQLSDERGGFERYAATEFARRAELDVVNTILASFTQEPGQLSGQRKGAYREEIRELRGAPTLSERALTEALRQLTRHRVPGRSALRLFSYDHRRERWALGRP